MRAEGQVEAGTLGGCNENRQWREGLWYSQNLGGNGITCWRCHQKQRARRRNMRRRKGRKKMGRRGRRKGGRGKGGQGRGGLGWRREGIGGGGRGGRRKGGEEGEEGRGMTQILASYRSTNSHQSHPRVGVKVKVLVAQLCPTLCNPMDCSPPGSSIHGILPARILEWVAIPFSRGSFRPGWEDSNRKPVVQSSVIPWDNHQDKRMGRNRPQMKDDHSFQPRDVNYDRKWWMALSSGGKHLRMNCWVPVFSEHLGFMK